MSEVASAYVSLLPSARGFGSKLQGEVGPEVNSAGSSMGKTFGKAFAAAGALVAAAGVGTLLKSAVSEASNAQQSIGATESIFKSFADTVIASSKDAAQEFGLSANEYRESANLIGSLFKNQGVELDELAGKTDTMIGRAADLSAMFGGTTREAVESLSSAFKGEFNPLEKYGITLSAAAINAELAARGHEDLEGAALAAAKQQATMDLIMRQSRDSMGTFSDEANTLAGQQQRLGAQWTDMKAALGTALLPALTSVASFVNASVLPAIAGLATQVRDLLGGGGGGGLSGVAATIQTHLLPVAQAMVTTFQTQILPAVQRLGAYLASTFGPVLAQAGEIIRGQVLPILSQFGVYLYGTVYPAVVRLATVVASNLKPAFDQLAQTYRSQVLPAVQQVLTKFQEWWPTIQRVLGVLGNLIARGVDMTSTFNGKVLPALIRFAGFILKNVVPAVLQQIEVTARIIGAVIEFGRALVDAVKSAQRFASGVIETGKEVVGWFADLPGRVAGYLSLLVGRMYSAGVEMMSMLAKGIKDTFLAPYNALKDAAEKLAALVPGSPVKDGPLRSLNNGHAGGQIMILLAKGIRGAADLPAGEMSKAMERVRDALVERRDEIKSVLDGFRSDFASLRDSIASTFTGNLFEAQDTAGFLGGMVQTSNQLFALKAAFKKLLGWGISPQFLAQLFQSGNAGLILDLAGGPRGHAQMAADLFAGVQSLGQSLGVNVAQADLGPKIDRTNQRLERIERAIDRLPNSLGRQINNAVSHGQRRAS